MSDDDLESYRQVTSHHRAIDLADEFSTAEVVGVDLAPIQPRYFRSSPFARAIFYLQSTARYQRTARK